MFSINVSHKLLTALLLFVLPLLTGACSSITKGTTQDIFLETSNVEDAKCTLANSKGEWTVESTPGYATIARGGGNMTVACSKINYHKTELLVGESVEEMTHGNALFGGLIGAAIDASSGAAYKYPETISIPMRPLLGNVAGAPSDASPATTSSSQTQVLENNKQDVEQPSDGNAVASSSSTILHETELKSLRGNWTGFAGNGCIDVGSNPASVTASAKVVSSKFQLLMEYDTVWGEGTLDFMGEGLIPTSRKLVFKDLFRETKEAVITFENSLSTIYVTLDTTCRIRLKRTNRQTIPANFKGKPPAMQEASIR